MVMATFWRAAAVELLAKTGPSALSAGRDGAAPQPANVTKTPKKKEV